MPKLAAPRRQGRPRDFDRTTALEAAMRLFWERGYEGASFDELARAMKLSTSSIYNAFGNKENLHKEALACYIAGPGAFFLRALGAAETARDAFAALLAETATAFTESKQPRGCYFSLAGLQIGEAHEGIRLAMRDQRRVSERVLVARIKEGIAKGDVPRTTDAAELGAYFDAVIRGMAVKARDGASRAALTSIAAFAMRAWPAP